MHEPLVFELDDAPAPAEACARFLDQPFPILLESAQRSARVGRYSYLSADPWLVLRYKDGVLERRSGAAVDHASSDPFAALEELLARHALGGHAGLPPFQGGVAGYLGYDLGQLLERVPSPRYDDMGVPDLCLGCYDWTLAWDHVDERCWLFSTGLPGEGPTRRDRAERRADEVRVRLRAKARPAPVRPLADPPGRARPEPPSFPLAELDGIRSTFSREQFLQVVTRVREYILAGDIFQANLSQRLEAVVREQPFALYERLRERNPAPFAAYFDCGDLAVASASPERFWSLLDGRVETRPIKGTSARGFNPRHDSALGSALYESEKDRAENVMIVDLLRNDLSKVCRDGSVEVPELWKIERYATVHHLVSTVVGQLRPGLGPVDLLRATWPGGSITGAPKVRAMEIIAELEPTRRGVYTGSLGYFSFSGAVDLSIAIRTFVVKGTRGCFQAGAGIVADSDPEREYAETLDKARGMAMALQA